MAYLTLLAGAMNLNIGCIEIFTVLGKINYLRKMNLNIGCIEISKGVDASRFGG